MNQALKHAKLSSQPPRQSARPAKTVITVLITGGAGFFGEILKTRLVAEGVRCVSIDLQPDHTLHPNFVAVQGDIRDRATMERLYAEHRFDCVYHLAAILAHAVTDRRFLWTSNVDGTRIVAEMTKRHSVPKLVFTSSNCLWADPFDRPVREDDAPKPREIYGASKWEGEKILQEFRHDFEVAIIRTPTIMEAGRLGLLAILYEFIDEGRRVWVVGDGGNRYQFCYAQDLVDACVAAGRAPGVTGVFNVGSDNVPTVREMYQQVINRAGTGARIASLPRSLALPFMRLAYRLNLSPLGPYQYRMIAESFVFDTTRIKAALGWRPTLTNAEMLWRAFEYFRQHRREIEQRTDVSAHKQPARMGLIRLLKWLS